MGTWEGEKSKGKKEKGVRRGGNNFGRLQGSSQWLPFFHTDYPNLVRIVTL